MSVKTTTESPTFRRPLEPRGDRAIIGRLSSKSAVQVRLYRVDENAQGWRRISSTRVIEVVGGQHGAPVLKHADKGDIHRGRLAIALEGPPVE